MVNTHTAIPTHRKARREREDKVRETQWCSGITCVLAGLRAHYPEHHNKKKEKEKEEEEEEEEKTRNSELRQNTTHHPTTAIPLPPHMLQQNDVRTVDSKHRTPFYPTQPPPLFHNDTRLNQQCCDSKHTEERDNTRETGTM